MNKTRDDHKIVRDLGFSLLGEGTILKIKAGGYSMYPSIKPGTTIFIEPQAEYINLVPGEIIAWKRESGFVVHRLIRTEKKVNEIIYITRGDSSKYEDTPVNMDQIAGKVIRIEDRKHRTIEGSRLIKKPCYLINRIIILLIIKMKRIYNFFITKTRGSAIILTLLIIPLCSFVMDFAILCGNNSYHLNHEGVLRLSQRITKELFSYPSVISLKASWLYESEV